MRRAPSLIVREPFDSLIKPSEKEIVEDLIVAAHGDARRKAEVLLQEKMKRVAGGLPLPPGMKLF
jgi:nucleoid-associated protein EbfC